MPKNEINQIPYIMERAKGLGMKIVLNPSPADQDILELPLGDVDYLILNEVEGAIISGVSQSDEEGRGKTDCRGVLGHRRLA